ncbi:hypothetical protein ACT453_29150, partial [Bacillus sp. D-CC]
MRFHEIGYNLLATAGTAQSLAEQNILSSFNERNYANKASRGGTCMMQKQNMIVVNQKEIAKNIYELVLQGTLVQQMNEPGQFVHIKVAEGIAPLL